MPNTVREDILQNVKTALTAITTGNGFDNTIASVQQWDPNGNSFGKDKTPGIIIRCGAEKNFDETTPLTRCELTIHLVIFTRIDEGASVAADTVLNSLLGDIKKKLQEDISRGGKARDTHVGDTDPFDSQEGQGEVGLIVDVLLEYAHLQTDPKTQR